MADALSERNYPESICSKCGKKTHRVPGRRGLCLDCFCHKQVEKLHAHIDKVTSPEYRKRIRKW